MQRVLVITFLAVGLVLPGSAQAQTPTRHSDPEIAHLLQLERDMWEAWRTHDLKALTALTAPDYESVNEFGRSTWPEVQAAFADVRLESYALGEMSAMRVARDVVIVTYPADIKGSYKTTDMSRKVAECSVWRREKNQWRNVFLHEVTVKQ